MLFRFDETNVERLGIAKVLASRALKYEEALPSHLPFPKIAATSLGFEKAERYAKQQLMAKETLITFPWGMQRQYFQDQIRDSFESYADCKSTLALRRSQILL